MLGDYNGNGKRVQTVAYFSKAIQLFSNGSLPDALVYMVSSYHSFNTETLLHPRHLLRDTCSIMWACPLAEHELAKFLIAKRIFFGSSPNFTTPTFPATR